ncbi:sensor histidine kinase [Hydrogenophaga sp.]|uniref:sensor histidine kinase n=1 Tax=Hydrogenophaga sp. TaxID=1904254 RepID=UPI00286D7DE8|nr:ATP-binding protein [Hydrogenophaga sp.]
MNAPPPPARSTAPLSRPFRIAVATVLGFGLFMQALLIVGVTMAERTIDRGVAPMQELLLIQRQAAQALQMVRQQDVSQRARCSAQAQDEACEVPLLLQNIAASAQRLLDGEGGLTGLPRSRALDGEARTVALTLRDKAQELLPLSDLQNAPDAQTLLQLQRGLLDANNQAHHLEQLVLAQLQQDFRSKHWLDLLAVASTGVLMAATVVTLFWMWSRVRSAFTQVQTSEARLRAYADAVPDTAYVLDASGQVLEIMGRPTARSDRPMTIPVGARLQDHRPPEMVHTYMQTIHRAISTREVQTLETELDDVRGEKHWFEARVAVIERPAAGAPGGHEQAPEDAAEQVIWLSRDVTGRIQTEQQLRQLNDELEQRVAERTSELHDAADELRRFNYTVSHDLRAPLRAVEAYTALAVEEAGDSLNPAARDLLERARKSAHQLAHMVESLLNLSRIGEIPLQPSWLDLSAMASDICQAFEIDRGDHRLQCHVEPGMTVWADEHLLRSLLQNLINNAVKYSAHREPALVEIGCQSQPDGALVVHVRDNGAGFDMARASQLFQPFTRLHSAKEFPGDGIGLATVRRIVMRHGGRIWAQGQVDAGATIYFTLPLPPRDREFTSPPPAPHWPDIET